MGETKQRNWGRIAAVLCVLLLALNLWQLRRISDLQRQLQNVETHLQMETRELNERILAVHRIVKDANTLVQEWEVISVGLDGESRCLRMEVSLRLKEWREDTQVHAGAPREQPRGSSFRPNQRPGVPEGGGPVRLGERLHAPAGPVLRLGHGRAGLRPGRGQ